MENKKAVEHLRRYNNFTGALGSNYIHLRNPWVVAWWSAAFPGLGHMKMGVYLKGFIFMIWEVLINVHSEINEAMVYSFTGEFQLTKDTLNIRVLFLYIPIYIITIWDSYRQCVDLNKHYLLAEFEREPIVPFYMVGYSLNYLDKRNPVFTLVISLLFPGLGHLYLHRIPSGMLLLSFSIVFIYMSNFFIGVQYTLFGQFQEISTVVNPEWLLFLPSLYCFAAYESYIICVEYNKLYKKEQRHFLEDHYQPEHYPLLQTKGE